MVHSSSPLKFPKTLLVFHEVDVANDHGGEHVEGLQRGLVKWIRDHGRVDVVGEKEEALLESVSVMMIMVVVP